MEEDWEPRSILVNIKNGKSLANMLKMITSETGEWSPFTAGGGIDCEMYHSDPDILHLRRLLKAMGGCALFLDADRRLLVRYEDLCQLVCNPERLEDLETFESLLQDINEMLKNINDEIKVKIARMSVEECARIDEAAVCLRHNCYYASTVMSVSAVESRLHALIKKKDKGLYEREFSKATLGQMIVKVANAGNADPQFSKVIGLIPPRHKPLLELLNVYRVYSAHPKGEEITAQIAESILHLSCALLIDPRMAPSQRTR